jgi:hypothetical protein
MAAPTAIATFGTFPLLPKAPNSGGLVINEAYLLVTSAKYAAKRTRKEHVSIATLAITAMRFSNPVLECDIQGKVSDATILTRHPGTTAAANVNAGASILGMDTTVGSLVYEDPEVDANNGDGETNMSFKMFHAPFAT